jgi:hypothetical protein
LTKHLMLTPSSKPNRAGTSRCSCGPKSARRKLLVDGRRGT